MKYEDIEDAIKNRLVAKLGNTVEVIVMPEFQAQNVRAFNKPRLTVAYAHSMFGEGRYGDKLPTISVDGVVQEENIQIKVMVEAKKLRGADGVYQNLVAVRQALIGFEPLGLDKLKIVEAKFDEFTDNLWSYQLIFGTKGYIIEDLPVTDEPLIKKVGFDQNFQVNL